MIDIACSRDNHIPWTLADISDSALGPRDPVEIALMLAWICALQVSGRLH